MPLPTTGYTVSSLTALLASGADDAWLVEIIDPTGQVHYKMTVAQLKLLATEDAVADSEFAAQSLIISVTAGTPVSATVGEDELVGRPAGGNVGSLTAAQVRAILNVEDAAAADQSAAEVPFTPDGDIAATDVQAAVVEVRNDTDTKLAGKADTGHAADHLTGGADEIDGDQLDIDFTPTNYTPDISPAEVTNADHLSAHLSGIDTALAGAGISGPGTSTDNAIARYNGVGGDTLQDSGVTVDDSDNLDVPGNVTVTGTVDGRDVAADGSKLDGIEVGADVTDGANVAAAGAVMDVDFAGSNAGAMIRTGATSYAIVQHNLGAAVGPSVTDDSSAGYGEGSLWVDATANEVYFCADPSVGAAVWRQIGAGGGTTDHGALTGLADDDHVQYILVDGTRAMTGSLDLGTNAIINVGNVDGRDVSADGTKLDGIESGADVTDAVNVAAAGAVMDTDFSGSNAGALIRTGASTYSVVQHNLGATTAPQLTSDSAAGYSEGSLWVNTTTNQVYFCADATAAAAVWRRIEGHHGDLDGLTDDDHVQYLLVNGTRAMSGDLDMGTNNITNVGTVDGRDLSADGTKLDGIESGATADQSAAEVPFTPDGDIAASNTQAAIVEVRDDTDTKLAGKADTTHAASHITGGSDEIDGDQLDIDYTPTNYTPTVAPAEVTNLDHLTAHLAGIDNAITAGSGDVVGPASATDNAVARFDTTTGKLLQNSAVTIDDSGNIITAGTVDGRDVSVDGTKLDSIEGGADITDATNVAAAGAVMDTDFTGTNAGALIRTGAASYDVIQHNLGAAVAPAVSDDSTAGYAEGSLWVDAAADEIYICADPSAGAAVWRQVASGGGTTDHGVLTGLADDDHTQYLLADGTRAMTGGLNVGTNGITNAGDVAGVGHIDLTTGTLSAHTEGRIDYDPAERTLIVYNDDANVTHQLGQELLIRVYNGTGSLIPDGSAVYEAGVQIEAGVGRPSVALAQADNPATSRILGVVTADIANTNYGWVTMRGFVNGLNLTAYSNGDLLYLSETVAGGYQTTFPDVGAGNQLVQVGIVAQATASGRLLVLATTEDIQDTSTVPLENKIGTPTVDTLRDLLANTQSPGIFAGGEITDDGDGTVTVAALSGLIRATDSDVAALLSFEVASTPITPATSDITYIYVEYNAGTPQVVGSTTEPTDINTNILLGTVRRNATTSLHITNRPPKLASFARDMHLRLVDIEGLSRATGAIVGETGTRNITVTEAELYLGIDKITSLAGGFDSSVADTFVGFYRDGVGGFNILTGLTQISNSQYDDGSGTLQSLGTGRYGVYWIYVGVDDHVYKVFGRGNYTSTQASAATPPADLPEHMQENHALLAAKVIVQQGASAFDSLETAFTKTFVGTAVIQHNDLSGLQGGAAGDYQHLTTAQVSKLTGIEALADVTDATNVEAAGAVMDTDFAGTDDGALIRTGTGPAAYAVLKHNLTAAVAPAVSDDSTAGYSEGSLWVDATANEVYFCADPAVGAAVWQQVGAGGGATDHGALTGLADDDHTQYVLVDGTRAMTGSLDVGGNNVTNVGTVDGRDVSVDGTKLDGIEAGADVTDATNVAAAGAVMDTDFGAQTILTSAFASSPTALTVAASRIVGRASTGNIDDLTPAQVRTIVNVEDGADVTDATNVAAAGAVMDSDFSGTNAGAMVRTGVGTYAIVQHNLSATTAPAVSNDNTEGYSEGSLWVDATNNEVYFCADAGTGAAVWQQIGAGGGVTDHGALTGLADDDHTQYLLVDGTRAMTGGLNMGTNAITNVGTVDGVDVSAHAARHITGGADEIDGDQLDIDYTPTNYTPTISPAEVTNLDHLTAHIAGIDTAIGAAGGGGPTVDTADTTSTPQTVTLPTLPSAGTRRIVMDTGNNAETNPITIDTTGADTIEGQSAVYILKDGGSMNFISDGNEWKIESVSTGDPVLNAIESFSSSNYYAGPTGALSGVTTGFSVEAICQLKGDVFNEFILGTGSGNSGYRLQFSFGTQLRFNVWDTGANFIDAAYALDMRAMGSQPVHIVGTLTDQTTFFSIALFLNGVQLVGADNFSTPNPYDPAGVTDQLGVGYDVDLAGDDGADLAIHGASYDANAWTPAQVQARYEEIKKAGRLVAGTLDPDNRWDGFDNLDAAATWSDVGSGTAQDLSRTGTPGTSRRIWR